MTSIEPYADPRLPFPVHVRYEARRDYLGALWLDGEMWERGADVTLTACPDCGDPWDGRRPEGARCLACHIQRGEA